MDSLLTRALPPSFPLYKSVLLPLLCRDLHMAGLVADPELQFSADPNKPIFADSLFFQVIKYNQHHRCKRMGRVGEAATVE